jgi:hypothetical protein
MAIKPDVNYAGKINAADANYPYGSARNVTVPGDGTGTPWEAAGVNDVYGFQQKLLNAAGITPSGNSETIVASDYFNALVKLFAGFPTFNDSGAVNAVQLAARSGADPAAYVDGQEVGFYVNNTNTGATTLQIAALGAIAFERRGGTAFAGGELVAGKFVKAVYLASGPRFELATDRQVGQTVQSVNVQDGAVQTGTTIMPIDDTIPQSTEGDEYMTLAIKPTKSTNKLVIEVKGYLAHSAAAVVTAVGALFQDATANAIAVGTGAVNDTADAGGEVSIKHTMVAGTTSSTTFKFRAGFSQAGTTTFNGRGGVREFGGVYASSITITEIEV